jgi:hypothetical protein
MNFRLTTFAEPFFQQSFVCEVARMFSEQLQLYLLGAHFQPQKRFPFSIAGKIHWRVP